MKILAAAALLLKSAGQRNAPMTKFDLGTLISAVTAFAFAVLIAMRDIMGRVLRAVRVSIVAFVASPAVWLAAFLAGGVAFWGGWWLGHSTGAEGRADLAAQVSLLKSAATKQELARAELARKLSGAEAEIFELRKPTEPTAAPRTPVARRPVPKAPQIEKAATAPPVTPWWPFDR